MDEQPTQPTKRQRPLIWLKARTWRFWAVTVLMLPVVYAASFGPACWLPEWNWRHGRNLILDKFYWPIGRLAQRGPPAIETLIRWYGGWGLARNEPRILWDSPERNKMITIYGGASFSESRELSRSWRKPSSVSE